MLKRNFLIFATLQQHTHFKPVDDITNDWNFPGIQVVPFLINFAPFHSIEGLEAYWPYISFIIVFSYLTVAAGIMVVYDWVLTLGQEIELIWKQRWSLMTVLYLITRYIGIPYSVANLLQIMPSVSLTDAGCDITYYVINGTILAMDAMLGVIMIARLYAMYQGSKKMLIFLVIIFLAVNIACGVIGVIGLNDNVGEEFILSGMHACSSVAGYNQLLLSMNWILKTVWEVLALCLSVWVAVKHFRELRRLGPSTGSTIGDCFRVLIQSHVLYFASSVSVSFLQLALLFPEILNSSSIGFSVLGGTVQILSAARMFVLGPRLILSVREYHARLVARSDTEFGMNSIVFQEHVHVSTSSTV